MAPCLFCHRGHGQPQRHLCVSRSKYGTRQTLLRARYVIRRALIGCTGFRRSDRSIDAGVTAGLKRSTMAERPCCVVAHGVHRRNNRTKREMCYPCRRSEALPMFPVAQDRETEWGAPRVDFLAKCLGNLASPGPSLRVCPCCAPPSTPTLSPKGERECAATSRKAEFF